MKKAILAMGVTALFAATAHAQSSVTLYGSLDAGLIYSNNQMNPTTKKAGSDWQESSNGISHTYFGLAGNEDLGSGLHAIFKLESGFGLNNGQQMQTGTIFNRQAYVGLESDRYGAVTLGRQYDSMVDYLSPLSMTGTGNGNNLAAHPFDNDNLDETFSVSNAIKYTSVDYNGFKFGGLYGFSNGAGEFSNNRAWSVGTSYSNGPINVAAAYMQLNNAGSTNINGAVQSGTSGNANFAAQMERTFGVGANYTYGPATVGLVWTQTQINGMQSWSTYGNTFLAGVSGMNLHLDNFEVNGKYALTPALTLSASYTYTEGHVSGTTGNGSPDWQTVALESDYALSKRTDVYLEGVYQHASGSLGNVANVADINTLSPSSTANQTAVTVGIQHRF
ncbi:MAG: ral bacterial porin, family [Paraburkholderia sp.]|nr:ral bacterial porin, family [Paraburkholderia sp.]